ncbi:TetR family transcriptional regulator [Compostibacillus humi]|uniref:TetR family transcriptional regulator n=1 Tax=Compostibacillus humi TaxID=1245525 RepID=A0A8J2TR76_9BACI|nr:TetR/AcrR family transcriptional regulator [Compostibacillus humi]GFZ83442.1 TetR family transcriptional regulator [Compostibacillus humi]HLT56619.1 TetR/AcrR family transcriptional regulator [Bacillota bacterium]
MDGFERRREQKKKDILQAALSLFLKYGVQKVSVAEIAKEAAVSQVTIYNYFESKDNLVHEVIIFYTDTVWQKYYEEIFESDLSFSEKITKIIFEKKETAEEIHPDFYQYFMKEYANGISYMEKLYTEQVLPKFIELFNEGKAEGLVDPTLSNEAIIFYIQMFKEYFQREDAYEKALPITEDLTKLFFYGIAGNK